MANDILLGIVSQELASKKKYLNIFLDKGEMTSVYEVQRDIKELEFIIKVLEEGI